MNTIHTIVGLVLVEMNILFIVIGLFFCLVSIWLTSLLIIYDFLIVKDVVESGIYVGTPAKK